MNISYDGTMINIRGEGWKEVKIVTISAVEAEVALERDEEKEVQLTRHSYRAGLWEVKEFAKQQWAEGCRRSLEKARQIVSVNDGAAWIWLIIAICYAPCIEIIDWWHAVEKLLGSGQQSLGPGPTSNSRLGQAPKRVPVDWTTASALTSTTAGRSSRSAPPG